VIFIETLVKTINNTYWRSRINTMMTSSAWLFIRSCQPSLYWNHIIAHYNAIYVFWNFSIMKTFLNISKDLKSFRFLFVIYDFIKSQLKKQQFIFKHRFIFILYYFTLFATNCNKYNKKQTWKQTQTNLVLLPILFVNTFKTASLYRCRKLGSNIGRKYVLR